jgi:hypothetical protein
MQPSIKSGGRIFLGNGIIHLNQSIHSVPVTRGKSALKMLGWPIFVFEGTFKTFFFSLFRGIYDSYQLP